MCHATGRVRAAVRLPPSKQRFGLLYHDYQPIWNSPHSIPSRHPQLADSPLTASLALPRLTCPDLTTASSCRLGESTPPEALCSALPCHLTSRADDVLTRFSFDWPPPPGDHPRPFLGLTVACLTSTLVLRYKSRRHLDLFMLVLAPTATAQWIRFLAHACQEPPASSLRSCSVPICLTTSTCTK